MNVANICFALYFKIRNFYKTFFNVIIMILVVVIFFYFLPLNKN